MSSKGIKSLLPRHLNQDPWENFFGAVRSVGCIKPTYGLFVIAYKTLLLNNLVSAHSPGANCEEDFAEGSLATYKNLFFLNQEIRSSPNISVDLPIQNMTYLSETTEKLQQFTHTYISGFIIKKLNKSVLNGCSNCLKKMCSDQISSDHKLIVAREYNSMLNL